ncbi:MAG: ABC transporter permease [Thermicanus sp.]|nr:ABC transporter permease [Thermicanus sp.]
MTLFTFTVRSMLHRKWSFLFSILTIILSFTLVLTIHVTADGVKESLKRESTTYEMVVGAEGSATQLVLNALMRMDTPLGNIPFSLYEKLKEDDRVLTAVPIALGDTYLGVPIVGTDLSFFQPLRPGMSNRFRLKEGSWFQKEGEVVVGAEAANRLQLTLGKEFFGNHGGKEGDGEAHHNLRYRVVGILEATGGADDWALFTPLESLWRVHGQKEDGKEITAILVKPEQMGYLPRLKEELSGLNGVQAAYSVPVFRQLLNWVERMSRLLTFVSYLSLFLTLLFLISMLISTAIQRKGELALLRALGIRKEMIRLHLLLESGILLGSGILGGWLFSLLLSALFSRYSLRTFGLPLPLSYVDQNLLLLALFLFFVGLLVTNLPYQWLYRRKGMERGVVSFDHEG